MTDLTYRIDPSHPDYANPRPERAGTFWGIWGGRPLCIVVRAPGSPFPATCTWEVHAIEALPLGDNGSSRIHGHGELPILPWHDFETTEAALESAKSFLDETYAGPSWFVGPGTSFHEALGRQPAPDPNAPAAHVVFHREA